MPGHVNMMDDVLVSNLPEPILRSALRLLISQGASTQAPFVQHVRERLTAMRPPLPPPSALFPAGSSEASAALRAYLCTTRCIFSCKLVEDALPYLTYLLSAIVDAQAAWTPGSSLEAELVKVGGDIVQAIQALKEECDAAKPAPAPGLEALLRALVASMRRCARYCADASGGGGKMDYLFRRPERQVRDGIVFLYPGLAAEFGEPAAAATAAAADVLNVVIRPEAARAIETFQLGSVAVPRLLNGFWQLSSPAWGSGTAETQTRSLVELVEAGLTAADMADHYVGEHCLLAVYPPDNTDLQGDAELIYGDFRNRLPAGVREKVLCATKWCVFKPAVFTTDGVLAMVRERARRVGGTVDLLQFHWYDYNDKHYLQVLEELVRITRTHPGLVAAIGLCNFDSEHTAEACEHLLKTVGEVGIVSNQVQFSLFDSRPLKKMADVCETYGLKLLVYGAFCGGMLSAQWIGQPVPEIYAAAAALTPSQRKYLDIMLTWSSWADVQRLLAALAAIAAAHGVSATTVAARWVLQQRAVGAVIVGTRLGVSGRWRENLQTFGWTLDAAEMARINRIALGENGERCDRMYELLGDCGHEYRRMH